MSKDAAAQAEPVGVTYDIYMVNGHEALGIVAHDVQILEVAGGPSLLQLIMFEEEDLEVIVFATPTQHLLYLQRRVEPNA